MTQPQPRYKPGDKIGGRYQVYDVKMGGMGEVYLCLDLKENYPYALKTFQQRYQSAALHKAFEQEVTTWVALEKHPNIVRCFYMDIFDNQPFMVLEWIAGEEGKGADLRGWLRRGPLDLKTALEIIIDVVRGLIHAQEKQPGLVHRDLKPENILVAQGGLAKITDFGLAQIVESAGLEFTVAEFEAKAEGRQSLVHKGGIAGTPAYMAPEQWREEVLDQRTDIKAVGCILYELLTGQWPFRVDFNPTTPSQFQEWQRAMEHGHEKGRRPLLPLPLPRELNELVGSCLAPARTDRPSGLGVVVKCLVELYQQQFDQLPPARPATTTFTINDYNNRGVTYHNLKRHEAALADFGRVIALDPDYALAYSNRGNTYQDLQQYEAALTDYEQTIKLDPTYAKAYTNRGNTYQALQQHEAAMADYDRAIALEPTDATTYYNRGNTYNALQRYEDALANYNHAIQLDPTLAKAYTNRGNTYTELEWYEAALADYNQAIELDPTSANPYGGRGNTYKALQLYEAALADYSRAIQLDPTLVKVYTIRGETYQVLQKYEEALADYGRAIELDATSAIPFCNRGTAYHDLQRYEEALADYGRAIELEPTDAQAYGGRGTTYAVLQRYEEALADFGRAIQLNPTDAKVYANRGTAYHDLQRYEEALVDYERAIEFDPSFAQAYVNLGALLGNLGHLREALPYFEQAAQLGNQTGGQYAAHIRQQMLNMESESQINPAQQAFAAFQQAGSVAAMRQAVTCFSFMAKTDFITATEHVIAQQVPLQQRPYFEQRLGWLRQIAQEQNQ